MQKKIIKPWGYEIIWAELPRSSICEDGYLGKIIHIETGKRLSLQFHTKKNETILVTSGVLHLYTKDQQNNENLYKLETGESFNIQAGLIHRFEAIDSAVSLIEVSTNYPDDVIRIEDDWNRK